MKFSYKKYNGILRPVIPIKLKNKGQEIGYQVFVDSGADFSLFNAEIGEAVGIDIKSGKLKTIFGVGGKTSLYYLHKVIIEIGNKEYEIEAGFMLDVAGKVMPYGLVGQRGFFENFIVKFDLLKEEINLKPRI
jgi:hypothetical protein